MTQSFRLLMDHATDLLRGEKRWKS